MTAIIIVKISMIYSFLAKKRLYKEVYESLACTYLQGQNRKKKKISKKTAKAIDKQRRE